MDIRPRPVSIFDDYGAIKENIYVMLRKQARKWQHQTSRQSLRSWEFCTTLWSCFSDSLKIVFFQMQQVFIIESQSELFKLFLQLGNNAKLLILCFLTSWAVAVTSVQGNAFSRKKDAVWKFQCVVLFFVKLFFFKSWSLAVCYFCPYLLCSLYFVSVSMNIVIKTFLFKLHILFFHQ